MSRITRFYLLAALAGATASPVPAAPGATLRPEISVALRGVADRTIEVGEPLFVAVRIEVPDESNVAIELTPASGTWADGVEVEVTGPGGGIPALRARPTGPPAEATATLDGDRIVAGVWTVASAVTGQLVPGDYRVRARLVIRDGKGWTGDAASDEIGLHIAAPSVATERVIQRTLALAHEAVLADAPQEAARLIDVLLGSDPDNIRLLMARAALCLRGGEYRAAMLCVNRATSRVEREKWAHPPIGLFELENQVATGLTTPGVAPANPPEWTRLPASVLAPRPDERLPKKTPERPASVTSSVAAPLPSVRGGALAPASTTSVMKPVDPPAGVASVGVVVFAAELIDAKIATEPNGQWAASAAAGSQYGTSNYSASKMAGAPDVLNAGDSVNAWCHHSSAKGLEWIELTYATPLQASEVRVRQNSTPGTIVKVEVLEPDGTAHLWWEGTDPYVASATRDIVWFAVRVPKTGYLVAKVKITLNLAAVSGWKEIDAVQLVGTTP